jgi:hypothetical protein
MRSSMLKLPQFLLLALLVLVVACNKTDDNLIDSGAIDWEEELELRSDDIDAEVSELDAEFLAGELGLRGPCFNLVFPVSIEFPDGTIVEAETLEELKEAIAEWKSTATPGGGRPHLVFPFDVETADGEIVTVTSKDDLFALKKECARERKIRLLRKCFDLVYPVTVVLPNGDEVEIADKGEMKLFIRIWRHAHRGHDARPKIKLPFEVELEDGSILEITSKDDLIAAIKDCKG